MYTALYILHLAPAVTMVEKAKFRWNGGGTFHLPLNDHPEDHNAHDPDEHQEDDAKEEQDHREDERV